MQVESNNNYCCNFCIEIIIDNKVSGYVQKGEFQVPVVISFVLTSSEKTFSGLLLVRSLRCQSFLDGQTVLRTSEKQYVDSNIIGLQECCTWLLFLFLLFSQCDGV